MNYLPLLPAAACLAVACFLQGENAPAVVKPVARPVLHFTIPDPVPAAKKKKRQGDFRKNLSGIALSDGGKRLWVVDDETVAVQPSIERLSLKPGDSFGDHVSFGIGQPVLALPTSVPDKGRVPEIDAEGLCIEGGYLWVIGSHSLNRTKPDSDDEDDKQLKDLAEVKMGENRFVLARIPMVKGEGGLEELRAKGDNGLSAACLTSLDSDGLIPALRAEDPSRSGPSLGFFIPPADPQKGIPSKDNGLDIEGLVVFKDHIFLGLRGPVLRGWAVILEIAVQNSDTPGKLKLKALSSGQMYAEHFVHLGGCGIRDLCADGDDLLVLAGPTMDLDGPSTVFRWEKFLGADFPSKDSIKNKELDVVLRLPVREGGDHAEGIALYPPDASGKRRLLVLYDSPFETFPTPAPDDRVRPIAPGDTTEDYIADLFELP